MTPASDLRRRWVATLEKHAPWLLAVYLLVLFSATHYPQDLLAAAPVNGTDKILHVLSYAVAAALVTMRVRGLSSGVTIVVATLITIAIGLFDEVTQPIFNRMYDPLDLAADLVGAVVGSWAWLSIRRAAAEAQQA